MFFSVRGFIFLTLIKFIMSKRYLSIYLSAKNFLKRSAAFGAAMLLLTFSAFSQDRVISGIVKDDASAAAIPGVTVNVKGSKISTQTDTDGKFTITVKNAKTLVFTYIGYLQKEVAIGSSNAIDVDLTVDAKGLGEVVVVGYGSQTRRNVTGAVQNIGAKEIKDLPVSQVTQKLQGKLAGVQINQTTGRPGQGMSVRIRGQFSVSAGSQPLYVVDGFPITGDISNLNPDEIDDISILKDAASTSLYGSRAANGVVLITTKKAQREKQP
jgi:TonB-dependent SusC/RagA subfamily outer membrane receptor